MKIPVLDLPSSLSFFSLLFLFIFLPSPLNAVELNSENVIAMASEGAPSSVSSLAAIMVFENGAFRELRKGQNNFTCMVISDPFGRYEPSCFNEQAMRSVFHTYQREMALLYSGKSREVVNHILLKEFENGLLPTAEPASLVYMMSPNNKWFNPVTQLLESTPVHQMYYFPKISDDTFALSHGPAFPWQGYPHLTALIVVVNEADSGHMH